MTKLKIKKTENVDEEEIKLNRWNKHSHDRLYIEGWDGRRNYDPYIDLKNETCNLRKDSVEFKDDEIVFEREDWSQKLIIKEVS